MGLGRSGNVLWVAMVLGGVALGAYVLLAWPEPTSRLVRLPYGESLPKTVRVAAQAQKAPAAVAGPSADETRVPAAVVAEPELAAAAPEEAYEGPPPVASESEGSYVESAEELGAEPLPGFGPEPTPAARDDETSTAAPAPEPGETGDDEAEPVFDVVIELPQPPSAAK